MAVKSVLLKIDLKVFQSFFVSMYQQYRYKKLFAQKIQYKIEINYNKKITYLDELAELYGTNKGGLTKLRRDDEYYIPLTYTDYYQLLFNERENVKKVFECGVGSNNIDIPSNMGKYGKPGASLRMWRDFFPNANIYGGDIDKSVLFSEDRIKTYFMDQLNADSVKDFWNSVGEDEFDLMIDDGLHRFEAGRVLFLNSISFLAESGIYIIEDITHDNLIKYYSFFSNTKYQVKYIKFYGVKIKSGQDSNNNIIEI